MWKLTREIRTSSTAAIVHVWKLWFPNINRCLTSAVLFSSVKGKWRKLNDTHEFEAPNNNNHTSDYPLKKKNYDKENNKGDWKIVFALDAAHKPATAYKEK